MKMRNTLFISIVTAGLSFSANADQRLIVGYPGSGVIDAFNLKSALIDEIESNFDTCTHDSEDTTDEQLTDVAQCAYEVAKIYYGGVQYLSDLTQQVIANVLTQYISFSGEKSQYNLYAEDILSNKNDEAEIVVTDDSVKAPSSNIAPAYTYFKNVEYLVYVDSNNNLMFTTRSHNEGIALGWREPNQINTHKSSDKPAAVVFNNRLYVTFKGSSSNKIYLTSTSDGQYWTQAQQIMEHQSNNTPDLAVISENGVEKLIATFRGSSSKNIYVVGSYDGDNWFNITKLSSQSSNGPSITTYKNKLYMTYKGASTDTIYINRSTDFGLTWPVIKTMPSSYRSNRGPAVAAHADKLYLVYKGVSSDRIYSTYSTDGINWSDPKYFNTNKTSGSLTLESVSLP